MTIIIISKPFWKRFLYQYVSKRVFVFPGPRPQICISRSPILNLYLPAPVLDSCLPVLRFTVKVPYSYKCLPR